MRVRIIIITLLVSSSFFALNTADAFDPFSVVKIMKTINQVRSTVKAPTSPALMVPFGGKIVESGTACKLHYWTLYFIGPIPVTHPGPPIPLFGTKIKVDQPGLPISNAFTFPGVTKIYPNKHEDRVGVWTLGIATKYNFTKTLVDTINSSLGKLTPISVGPVTFFKFSLSCPDGGIILKIGTS